MFRFAAASMLFGTRWVWASDPLAVEVGGLDLQAIAVYLRYRMGDDVSRLIRFARET